MAEIRIWERNRSQALLKPKHSLHLVGFNARILTQIGQLDILAGILETFEIDECCVSEMHIQDSISEITVRSSNATSLSRFTHRAQGDPISNARVWAGLSIAPSMGAKRALLECISTNIRLCAVRLKGSVSVSGSQFKHRCFLVIFMYTASDCSSPEVKDELNWELSELVCNFYLAGVMVVAGDFSTELRYSGGGTERDIG